MPLDYFASLGSYNTWTTTTAATWTTNMNIVMWPPAVTVQFKNLLERARYMLKLVRHVEPRRGFEPTPRPVRPLSSSRLHMSAARRAEPSRWERNPLNKRALAKR